MGLAFGKSSIISLLKLFPVNWFPVSATCDIIIRRIYQIPTNFHAIAIAIAIDLRKFADCYARLVCQQNVRVLECSSRSAKI